jgi:hypothetical protein
MKLLILIILAMMGAVLMAAEPEFTPEIREQLKRLEDDDFDVRERATKALGALPAEYASLFLKMSKEADPEVGTRLWLAARQVFCQKILAKDPDWLVLHGEIGADMNPIYTYTYDHPQKEGMGGEHRRNARLEIIQITSDGTGASEGKLESMDRIVAINGREIESYDPQDAMRLLMTPDQVVKLRIKRPIWIQQTENHSYMSGEFTDVEVEIKVGWKDQEFPLSAEEEARTRVTQEKWSDFWRKAAAE